MEWTKRSPNRRNTSEDGVKPKKLKLYLRISSKEKKIHPKKETRSSQMRDKFLLKQGVGGREGFL